MAKAVLGSFAAFVLAVLPIGALADAPAWAKNINWQHDTVRLPVSGSTLVVPSGASAATGPAAPAVLTDLTDQSVSDPKAVEAVVVADNFIDYVVLQYYATGYIRGDDWKDLNPNDLYTAIAAKIPPASVSNQLHLQGWLERPAFDSQSGEVRWAVSLKAGDKPMVNYKVLKLSRGGYEALTWATLGDGSAGNLLEAVNSGFAFGPDQRYADHQGSDPAAAFGVGGLAKAAASGDPFPQAAIAFGFANIAVYVLGALLVGVLVQLVISASRPASY
jgi:uncharacterized membrane-anchored protein